MGAVIRTSLPSPVLLPSGAGIPVLLSVPHSGTDYPDWLIRDTRRGRRSLEPLEDPLVDRLVWRAAALGCGAVVARTPRAAIDCNRSPQEIDPTVVSVPPGAEPGARARGGLGIIPGRTPADGELWRRKIGAQELEQRMAQAWQPYHAALGEKLDELRGRFVEVLLLDCHSMPTRTASQPRLVIGDRHGRSCARWLGDLVRRTAEGEGISATFNDPYAGGFIVEQHGRPESGVHALQLELDRGLYLDRSLRRPGPGFDRVARLLEVIARVAGDALLARGTMLQAAE